MTAPLAPFLTRFSDPLPALLASNAALAMPSSPIVSLTQDELEARIDAARHEAEALAAQRYAAEAAATADAHAAAMRNALEAARAEWCAAESERLTAQIAATVGDLRNLLSRQIAAVLQPWIATTVRMRVQQELAEAIDRLLTIETSRSIRVCGPDDLIAVLREARPDADIDWQSAETIDVSVIADTTRLETRLGALLTEFAMEGRDVE